VIAYTGQTRSRSLVSALAERGIGECVVRGELPARREPFFHDNGAFRDWRAGRPFGCNRWARDMRSLDYTGIVPDFVVVPDIVAGGVESLAFSEFWRDVVPERFPAYLAVQDGMTAADVEPHLARYDGIFVGGSLGWKLATSAEWVRLAHARGLRCHVGRVGVPARVRWARALGVDSIDSSYPLRNAEVLAAFLAALDEDDGVPLAEAA
jgi:hypothetical protein